MMSDTGTNYIGLTNNLSRRINEHKQGIVKGYTKKYKCNKLVYIEEYSDIREAISREKQLKNWNRKKKIDLIKIKNPELIDLTDNTI